MAKIEKSIPTRLRRGRPLKYQIHLLGPDSWFRVTEPPNEISLRTYVSKRAKELGIALQVLKQEDGSFLIYRKAER